MFLYTILYEYVQLIVLKHTIFTSRCQVPALAHFLAQPKKTDCTPHLQELEGVTESRWN